MKPSIRKVYERFKAMSREEQTADLRGRFEAMIAQSTALENEAYQAADFEEADLLRSIVSGQKRDQAIFEEWAKKEQGRS